MATITYIDDKTKLPIRISAGSYADILLPGSAGTAIMDIRDNADELTVAPVFYGSFDGQEFEPMSAEFMRKLLQSNADMTLRVDCRQLQLRQDYLLYRIVMNKQYEGMEPQQKSDFYYDASLHAIDEDMLHAAVKDNIQELNNLAQDCLGWPVQYYRAEVIKNVDILNAYELRSITDYKTVQVFFPHRKTIGQLDFDQFGLSYDELTTLHVLPDEFHRVYDDTARPGQGDIVYIAFLDQFFEITDINDIKTPINTIAYFECTLRFISDRQSVAKDDDILDLGSLVNGEKIEEVENAEPATYPEGQPDSQAYHDINPDVLPEDIAIPVKIKYDAQTWKGQVFETAMLRELYKDMKPCYGIAHVDAAWYEQFEPCQCGSDDCKYNGYVGTEEQVRATGWVKIEVAAGTLTIRNLQEATECIVQMTDMPVKVYFAKFAQFNTELSKFERTMYYTTPVISRTLQPLDLIELQTVAE